MARARNLAAAALCLAVAAAALPAGAGAATWIVNGAGWGHGVGLGAYGAYGFGKHGYGYRQILAHYYRGISLTTLERTPMVSVLLTTAPGEVRFGNATKACGARLEPQRSYRARRRGEQMRLLSNAGNLLAVCGGRLQADSAGTIRVDGVGSYRGALVAVPGSPGGSSLNLVNRLNVNNYARGVVPREVPPSWPMATLKTFAVTARSIGLSTDVGGRGFDLYPDTRTQVYGGLAAESERTDRAVAATANEVATYRGEVAQTVYSSSTGGRTESGFLGAPEVPYLRSVPDPYDRYSPQHRWTVRFTQAEINARLGGYVPGALRGIRVTKRGDSPRIEAAQLIGTRGTATIRGDTLQYALGLYDRWAYFRKAR